MITISNVSINIARNRSAQLLINAILSHAFVDFFTAEITAINETVKNK
jgi:hypothetical protein